MHGPSALFFESESAEEPTIFTVRESFGVVSGLVSGVGQLEGAAVPAEPMVDEFE